MVGHYTEADGFNEHGGDSDTGGRPFTATTP